MSLCLVNLTRDKIYIAGDSRTCRFIDGEAFAVDDEVYKIQEIGDKVIFYGGNEWVNKEVLRRWQASGNLSIANLNDTGRAVVDDFNEVYSDAAVSFKRLFEMVVATFEDGIGAVYSLSSYEGYRIKKEIGDEQETRCCIGTHRDDAIKIFRQFQGIIPTITLFTFVYASLADEEMGGTLRIYELEARGIKKAYEQRILDRRPIKRAQPNILTYASIGPDRGFVVTRSDGICETSMNATDGITIELKASTTASYTAVFYVAVDTATNTAKLYLAGDAVFTGEVKASAISGGTIDGTAITGVTIAIGSGNNTFKADANGIYLGNATFGSAPFRVTMSGAVTASNLNMVGGSITAGDITITSNVTVGAKLYMKTSAMDDGIYFDTADNDSLTVDPGGALTYSSYIWAAGFHAANGYQGTVNVSAINTITIDGGIITGIS